MARLTEAEAGRNVPAFLDMIAHAEGVARFSKGQDGYDVIVGGGTFSGYADHPRKLINLPRYGIKSSAAGRYQFIIKTWDALAKQLKLKDFSPENQDRAAIQLIRDRGALDDVKAGRFDAAVRKVANIWASMPGAGYGQREVALAELKAVFQKAGGVPA